MLWPYCVVTACLIAEGRAVKQADYGDIFQQKVQLDYGQVVFVW